MHLFVYGTLKRGQPRHRFLAGQTFVAHAVTRPLYRMFNVGEYPALVRHAEGRSIEGEVWEVDEACLRALDRVEGCDFGLYARLSVELSPPFEVLPAETYLYQLPVEGLADCGSRW
ncbi:MAG TPA: gamma-glutamylcyclotransferase family protein [Planctomycetaceae bacterium]|nr:gamma-glutamylcyclotransferase family protein [Planctomycetaceae bacterium]